jgi:hypothetical protein
MQRCFLLRQDGAVVAQECAEQGDGSWLNHTRGAAAAGEFLFVPTDDGVVRVSLDGHNFVRKEFPDTQGLVDSASQLLAAPAGLYVVDRNRIRLLSIR